MSEKKVSPGIKFALEMGPILLFFVAYFMLKDRVFSIGGTDYKGFIVVTAGFVPLIVACTGILWWLSGTVSKMQIMTVILVVVFGGMTVWLNDPKFIKMKPTILYVIFGGLLAIGLLRGQSYLQHVMSDALPLKPEGWMILTRRIMWFFFALAALNEIVWRMMSEETWVLFKTFGLTAAVFGFFITQGGVLQTYALDQDET